MVVDFCPMVDPQDHPCGPPSIRRKERPSCDLRRIVAWDPRIRGSDEDLMGEMGEKKNGPINGPLQTSWGYKIIVTWNLVSMDQYGSKNNLIRFMAQFDRVMYWALILTHEGLLSEMLLGFSFLSVPIVGECLGWFQPRFLLPAWQTSRCSPLIVPITLYEWDWVRWPKITLISGLSSRSAPQKKLGNCCIQWASQFCCVSMKCCFAKFESRGGSTCKCILKFHQKY
jgi:hypothetical protein